MFETQLEAKKQLKIIKSLSYSTNEYRFINVKKQEKEYSLMVFKVGESCNKINEVKLKSAKRQATILAISNHQNIAKYITEFQIEEYFCIQIESLKQSLYSWYQETKCTFLEANLFLSIAGQLFRALQYINQKGYTLRNFSLKNVYFDSDYKIKLIDFGDEEPFNKETKKEEFNQSVNESEYFYEPPELINNESYQISFPLEQGDVWRVGISLYILAGATVKNTHFLVKQLEDYEFQYRIDRLMNKLIVSTLKIHPIQRISLSHIIELIDDLSQNLINWKRPFKFEESIIGLHLIQPQQQLQSNFQTAESSQKSKVQDKQIENCSLYLKMANNFYISNEFENAILSYKKSIDLQENRSAYFNLGQLYQQRMIYDKAIECYQRVIQLDEKNPMNKQTFLNMGDIYMIYGMPLQAGYYYRQSLRINPLEYNNIKDLTYKCYMIKGQLENAIVYLKNIIEIFPQDFNAYLELGIIYNEVNMLEESKQLLLKALTLSNIEPHRVTIYLNLSTVYSNLQMPDQSKLYIRKTLEIIQDKRMEYFMIASLKIMENKFKTAIAYFKQYIHLFKDSNSDGCLGEAFMNESQHDKAILLVQRQLSQKPDFLRLKIILKKLKSEI